LVLAGLCLLFVLARMIYVAATKMRSSDVTQSEEEESETQS
jgi:hypothetical protein